MTELWREIRLALGDRLLEWALSVFPKDSAERLGLAKHLIYFLRMHLEVK